LLRGSPNGEGEVFPLHVLWQRSWCYGTATVWWECLSGGWSSDLREDSSGDEDEGSGSQTAWGA